MQLPSYKKGRDVVSCWVSCAGHACGLGAVMSRTNVLLRGQYSVSDT